MKIIWRVLMALLLIALTATAETKETRKQNARLQDSGVVMSEILNMPESIPDHMLDRTKCVAVIPSVRKAAFVVGASYGRGAMVCRTGDDFTGPWGAPSMMALEGGSFGLQAGAEATDFVFLIMNEHGATSLLKSKVKLGGDIAAVAGPVGRDAQAGTDAYMRAEILTYSRARGIFAGISLDGSTLRPDNDGNEALYGERYNARSIVLGRGPQRPPSAERLVTLLENASPVPANG
jgi:lipid-binding SYLF domain-containing protein